MRSRRSIAVLWLGALALLAVAVVVIPVVAARAGPAGQQHLRTVPDRVLAQTGIALGTPAPEAPGCEGFSALTTQLGHGRAAAQHICPGGYPETAARRRVAAMSMPGASVVEVVRADCSLPVARVSHRECWVLVTTGGSLRRYDIKWVEPALLGTQPAGVKGSPTRYDLVFIDAQTGAVLAVVEMTYGDRRA